MIEDFSDLPKITLNDFDFKSTRDKSSSRTVQSLPKLYTVSQSLQNAYIYKNLKPDLGSLNQFIDGGFNFKHQLKKKKHQKPQQPEEKRIKTFMLLRKQSPQDVLKNKDSTPLERKVAAKLLLDGIFAKEFGQQPEVFYQNNMKQKIENQLYKSIDKIDRQTVITNQNKDQTLKVKYYQDFKKKDDSNNESQHRKFKRRIIYNQQKIFKQIVKIKLKYKSLLKLKVDSELVKEINATIQDYKNKYQNIPQFQQANKYKTDCRKARSVCLQTSIQSKSSFIVNDDLFVLRKIPITNQEFLHLISKHISYENIRVIYLEDIPISDQALCLFFQVLNKYALYIQELTLIKLSSLSSPKITPILKTLVGNLLSLRVFCINQSNIDTKSFCLLCLGIGQSSSLKYFQATKNEIDSRVTKSLQILIRYIRQLIYIDLSGNKILLNPKQTKAINVFLQNYKSKTVFIN